ncbi:hypothetical protein CK203_098750 [Vitis vinifera]|uniref:Reverse transcriptase zinc-binding domain-containing protein n=1 Tax=Vitis vinifera TaxID=29760 RepID=A0A438EGD1_VITVI|nr:hypothetical protein CK203_098750 [Vitis vinifera]
MDDIMAWVETKNGDFSVKSFYSSLVSRRAKSFPHGRVWNSWAPVRASFFAWEVTYAKILTQVGGCLIRCYMSKVKEETMDDAFLDERIALELGWLLLFIYLFDRREIGEPLRIAKVWIKHLKHSIRGKDNSKSSTHKDNSFTLHLVGANS